ncbi:unnamed protein product [Blepharisma stoltei]|uniref:PH domain-containing protein n=1 Tax=Blepharisma stoltei TaxID=1481888 RepID=A0AAU9IPS8_9CILI|nr:unnamed protein product [Blepharisma stoltei]
MNNSRRFSSFASEELKGIIKLKRKRRWVKRYVVLAGGKLCYFKNQSAIQPRATIDLTGVKVNNIGQVKGENIFELVKPNFFSIKFAFNEAEEYKQWLHHITKYSEEFKNNEEITSDCRYEEDEKKKETISTNLLEKLNVTEISGLLQQRIKEIIDKEYIIVGNKGGAIYAENKPFMKTSKESEKNEKSSIFIGILVWTILSCMGFQVLSVLFLIALLSWTHLMKENKLKGSKRVFGFKTTILIEGSIGEILTTLNNSSSRILCEPYSIDITEGSNIAISYSFDKNIIVQDITRHFLKYNGSYLLVENVGPDIKSIFKLESKTKNGVICSSVTHYGKECISKDPLIGNSDIIIALKQLVDMTSHYSRDPAAFSTDNFESDTDDEEESKMYHSLTVPLSR